MFLLYLKMMPFSISPNPVEFREVILETLPAAGLPDQRGRLGAQSSPSTARSAGAQALPPRASLLAKRCHDSVAEVIN